MIVAMVDATPCIGFVRRGMNIDRNEVAKARFLETHDKVPGIGYARRSACKVRTICERRRRCQCGASRDCGK
jgi:hypothetical protein